MKTYGLQNETRQYLRRLYAFGRELQGSDISDIDNFVKGLKQLNLWGPIIFWSMRSQHNIGTGSTVLNLGGAGAFPGTMVNSPSWSSLGILFNGTSSYIALPDIPKLAGRTNFSYGGCAIPDITKAGDGRQILIAHDSAAVTTAYGVIFAVRANTGTLETVETNGGALSRSATVNNNIPRFQLSVISNSTLTYYFDGVNQGTDTTLAAGYNRLGTFNRIGVGSSGGSFYAYLLGYVPFCFYIFRDISNTEYLNLYSLYKKTIGRGIVLP